MTEYGSQHFLQFEFLDLTDSSLSAADKVNLSSIVQPSSLPLPGSGVVWKTPRNISPPGLEFGDGVSAVFKSLSVASPSPSRHAVPTTSHPALSASSSPFVPSIPIPLPAMGAGQVAAHPQTIHINNFTANLNYHGMQGMPSTHHNPLDNQDSPINSYPGPNGTPLPFSHHRAYTPQYVAPFPTAVAGPAHLHHPPQPQLYNDGGQYHPGGGVMFVPVPHSHPGQYPAPQLVQQRQREDPNPGVSAGTGGITFGSTPVVSIKNGKRPSESEEPRLEEKILDPSFTPSPIVPNNKQVRGYSKAESPPTNSHIHATPSPQSKLATPKQTPPQAVPNLDSPGKPLIQGITPTNPPPKQEPVKYIKSELHQEAVSQVSPNVAKSSKALSEPVKSSSNGDTKQRASQGDSEPAKAPVGAATLSNVASPSEASPQQSWASLFTAKTSNHTVDSCAKPTARIQPFSTIERIDDPALKEPNSAEKELGNFLKAYALKHVATALLPRGLTNRSNWCFVNAILQALLACPPFYNLMKNLPNSVLDLKTQKSKTPMLDSIVEFVNEFSVLEQMNKSQKKDKNRKKEDVVTGICLEPSYVYKMLLNLEEDTFKVVDGRQEDAEEFLTCLLNGLSDEMLAMMKLADEQSVAETPTNGPPSEDTADDWQEVGAKGKSCVTRRVANGSSVQTPIQSMALGMCRSSVKSESGDNSATLQPFYTLQLDIQDQTVQNVTDALAQNFANEQLDGFICSKTKKEIEATRIQSLEELPSILILHLKRFVYDGQTGGVQKIMKQIEFGVDLEIPKNILSAECRASPKQRQYKLFGVVYHNGREATKGHYVTDIYHTGYGTWLHCDDSIVQPTAEQLVVSPSATSTPYLLFYRRGDTMVGMEKKQ